MEENTKGFCPIHEERTRNIVELKDELKDSRKGIQDIKNEICNLEIKIDNKLDGKVNWSTFKWIMAGIACIMMFILGTQVTVLIKKEDLMSRADFTQWKDERNLRLDRIEDRLVNELQIMRAEIKELKETRKK